MIRIEGTRLGSIELEETAVIEMPGRLVGFPSETRFALLHRDASEAFAHFQSLVTPDLALLVLDGGAFGDDYPKPPAAELVASVGLGGNDVVLLVPVAVRPGDPQIYANLLAPILVDAASRRAVQAVLDPRVYAAWTPVSRHQNRWAAIAAP